MPRPFPHAVQYLLNSISTWALRIRIINSSIWRCAKNKREVDHEEHSLSHGRRIGNTIIFPHMLAYNYTPHGCTSNYVCATVVVVPFNCSPSSPHTLTHICTCSTFLSMQNAANKPNSSRQARIVECIWYVRAQRHGVELDPNCHLSRQPKYMRHKNRGKMSTRLTIVTHPTHILNRCRT